MGTAAGFGQTGMGQQTGVGAAPSTSGQTQPTGSQYGGKGGGLGLNPYAPQQQNTSTAPQQAYLPMGGTAFGYNMQRLAQHMDPSSTLPGDYQPQQTQQPQYQQPPMGGKGGGMGMRGQDYYGGYGPQAPQFFQPQYQQNPFGTQYSGQQDPYASRFSALEDKLNKLMAGTPASAATPAPAPASSEIVDTGEATYALPKTAEEFGVGTKAATASTPLTQDQIDTARTQTAADAAAQAAKVDPVTGKPLYQYKSYTALTPEQLSGLSNKSNITGYYNTQVKGFSNDIAQAKKDLAAATKAGDVQAIIAAQKQLNTANNNLASVKSEQTSAIKNIGKSGTYAAPATATPTPAPTTSAPAATPVPAPVRAPAPAPAPAPVAKAPAPAPKPTTFADLVSSRTPAPTPASNPILAALQAKKKAKGGVIHTGMTSNLKKQLKTK